MMRPQNTQRLKCLFSTRVPWDPARGTLAKLEDFIASKWTEERPTGPWRTLWISERSRGTFLRAHNLDPHHFTGVGEREWMCTREPCSFYESREEGEQCRDMGLLLGQNLRVWSTHARALAEEGLPVALAGVESASAGDFVHIVSVFGVVAAERFAELCEEEIHEFGGGMVQSLSTERREKCLYLRVEQALLPGTMQSLLTAPPPPQKVAEATAPVLQLSGTKRPRDNPIPNIEREEEEVFDEHVHVSVESGIKRTFVNSSVGPWCPLTGAPRVEYWDCEEGVHGIPDFFKFWVFIPVNPDHVLAEGELTFPECRIQDSCFSARNAAHDTLMGFAAEGNISASVVSAVFKQCKFYEREAFLADHMITLATIAAAVATEEQAVIDRVIAVESLLARKRYEWVIQEDTRCDIYNVEVINAFPFSVNMSQETPVGVELLAEKALRVVAKRLSDMKSHYEATSSEPESIRACRVIRQRLANMV